MYAYTQNNPVMYSDISGYFATTTTTTLLIFGGAVGAYIRYRYNLEL